MGSATKLWARRRETLSLSPYQRRRTAAAAGTIANATDYVATYIAKTVVDGVFIQVVLALWVVGFRAVLLEGDAARAPFYLPKAALPLLALYVRPRSRSKRRVRRPLLKLTQRMPIALVAGERSPR